LSTGRRRASQAPVPALTQATKPLNPPRPIKSGGPASTWPHRELYDRVIAALHALPGRFLSPLVIEGVPATDLFTMNTPLGAAIEASVVDSLNALRQLWDPKGAYASYTFVRQAQTFPDVLLKSTDPQATVSVLLGIELKGWFAIAKEGEPSFRYYASGGVCADADLLVVVPWIFDSVISGKPKLLQPIITEARFASEMRNYHWEFLRAAKSEVAQRGVTLASHSGFYPMKAHHYSDRAVNDGGGNFGRIARCGVMNNEVEAILKEPALGIPLFAWQRFLSIFSEKSTEASITRDLSLIETELVKPLQLSETQRDEVLGRIRGILEYLKEQA
jgi:hypothetical protein